MCKQRLMISAQRFLFLLSRRHRWLLESLRFGHLDGEPPRLSWRCWKCRMVPPSVRLGWMTPKDSLLFNQSIAKKRNPQHLQDSVRFTVVFATDCQRSHVVSHGQTAVTWHMIWHGMLCEWAYKGGSTRCLDCCASCLEAPLHHRRLDFQCQNRRTLAQPSTGTRFHVVSFQYALFLPGSSLIQTKPCLQKQPSSWSEMHFKPL